MRPCRASSRMASQPRLDCTQAGAEPRHRVMPASHSTGKRERWQSLVTGLSCPGLFAWLQLWLLTTFSGFLRCCYFGRSGTGRKRNPEALSPAELMFGLTQRGTLRGTSRIALAAAQLTWRE